MAAVAEGLVKLDYGRPRSRQRWQVAAIVAALVLAIFLITPRAYRLGRRWLNEWRDREMRLQDEKVCTNYTAPRDMLVFGEYEDEAGMLASAGTMTPFHGTCGTDGSRDSYQWCALGVTEWERVLTRANRGHGAPTGTNLFLHSRTSKGGQTRVVAVDLPLTSIRTYSLSPKQPQAIEAVWHSLALPASATGPSMTTATVKLGSWDRARRTRFYAGQPDPSDPARFTIRYQIDGKEGTIAGKLEDDLTVTLTVLNGLLMPSAATVPAQATATQASPTSSTGRP